MARRCVDSKVMRARAVIERFAAGGAREDGWTLIELLVSSSLLIVILTAVLAVLDDTQNLATQDRERAHTIDETAAAVYRMTRELRQSNTLNATGPYSFDAYVNLGGQNRRVVYDCSGTSSLNPSWGRCLRKLIASGGSTLSTTSIISAFKNTAGSGIPPIFSYSQNGAGQTTYVSVHVEVPAAGNLRMGYKHRVTYDDGSYLRNLDG